MKFVSGAKCTSFTSDRILLLHGAGSFDNIMVCNYSRMARQYMSSDKNRSTKVTDITCFPLGQK